MTKFPIANALKAEEPVVGLYGCDNRQMINHDAVRLALIGEDVAFFDVSLAAELYWHGRKDYYTLGQDFGPMRPPYDKTWMEWDVPPTIVLEGKTQEVGELLHYGALVHTEQTSSKQVDTRDLKIGIESYIASDECQAGPEWHAKVRDMVDHLQEVDEPIITITALMYMIDPETRTVVSLPFAHRIGIDDLGHFNGYVKALVPRAGTVDKQTVAAARDLADVNVVYMALNLINCRNVTTRQVGSALTRTTREKRQGVPVKRYHTIVLPGMSYRYTGGRHARNEERQLAAHRVRGHFKTFTPEKPLLGKHVGTYWWGWSLRGNPEHGTVESDYALGDSA